MKKIIFFAVVAVVVVASVYYESIVVMKNMRADRAETMSTDYVSKLYSEYVVVGKNCQGEDTNSDSYVSCDVRIQISDKTETQKVLNLACPTMWKSYTGSTCKERAGFVNTN